MSNESLFESLVTGLNEAIEDASSKQSKLRRTTISIEPVKIYKAEEVKNIRKSTGLTQKMFAAYMGVSDKTVEAWEAGTNHPSGAASRILSMMELDHELITRFPFVQQQVREMEYNFPPLSGEEKKEIEHLQKMPEEEIDTSDIQEITGTAGESYYDPVEQ